MICETGHLNGSTIVERETGVCDLRLAHPCKTPHRGFFIDECTIALEHSHAHRGCTVFWRHGGVRVSTDMVQVFSTEACFLSIECQISGGN
jgi:hypothetical protein